MLTAAHFSGDKAPNDFSAPECGVVSGGRKVRRFVHVINISFPLPPLYKSPLQYNLSAK
jgi:hypothetical protein